MTARLRERGRRSPEHYARLKSTLALAIESRGWERVSSNPTYQYWFDEGDWDILRGCVYGPTVARYLWKQKVDGMYMRWCGRRLSAALLELTGLFVYAHWPGEEMARTLLWLPERKHECFYLHPHLWLPESERSAWWPGVLMDPGMGGVRFDPKHAHWLTVGWPFDSRPGPRHAVMQPNCAMPVKRAGEVLLLWQPARD